MTDTSEAPDQAHPTLVPERASPSPALEVSKRPTPMQRLRLLWQYRELVGNLTRKELKVKYKNSVLGFLWTLLNPLSSCVTPANPQRFSGMVSADALDLVLYDINLIEGARRVEQTS